jgi:hypothetical protein
MRIPSFGEWWTVVGDALGRPGERRGMSPDDHTASMSAIRPTARMLGRILIGSFRAAPPRGSGRQLSETPKPTNIARPAAGAEAKLTPSKLSLSMSRDRCALE